MEFSMQAGEVPIKAVSFSAEFGHKQRIINFQLSVDDEKSRSALIDCMVNREPLIVVFNLEPLSITKKVLVVGYGETDVRADQLMISEFDLAEVGE